MDANATTAAIQRYLDDLAGLSGDSPVEPIVSALLGRSARRLHQLCASLLYRSYPRLTRPPYGLQSEELLGAVVERLLKAFRVARPQTVRQFFAIANMHMRWEMNDLARRLDDHSAWVVAGDESVPSPESSGAELTPNASRILAAIEALPEDEREVFSLVRFQGMTHPEVAEILGISTKTVQRRLNAGLLLLTEELGDLRPTPSPPDGAP